MPAASQELREHHVKEHIKTCEIRNPEAAWFRCQDGDSAVLVCMGCFEIIFNAIHPDPERQCEHSKAFIAHVERNLPSYE